VLKIVVLIIYKRGKSYRHRGYLSKPSASTSKQDLSSICCNKLL